MVGNLQQQGDNHSFDFFSGFQDDADFGHTVEFLDADFGVEFTYGDAFDFGSIDSWGLKYDNVLCDFSVERRLHRRRKQRRMNRIFRFKVKKIMQVQILHAPWADARNNA